MHRVLIQFYEIYFEINGIFIDIPLDFKYNTSKFRSLEAMFYSIFHTL